MRNIKIPVTDENRYEATKLNCRYMFMPEQHRQKVLKKLPTGVKFALEKCPDLALVGGFIRAVVADEEPKDIDLAFVGPLSHLDRLINIGHFTRHLQDAAGVQTGCYHPACALRKLPNCTEITHPSIEWPIQILDRMKPTVVETLESFDFNITQAAIFRTNDGKGWGGLYNWQWVMAVKNKELNYLPGAAEGANSWAAGSLLRALTFVERGYRLDEQSLGYLVFETVRDLDKTFQASGAKNWAYYDHTAPFPKNMNKKELAKRFVDRFQAAIAATFGEGSR
jgi:hypothetical protein